MQRDATPDRVTPAPVVIHVAAGCYPPSMPLLVRHPRLMRTPTWFRWSDLVGSAERRTRERTPGPAGVLTDEEIRR